MKKLIIGIMILGLASLGYAQSATSEMEEVKLSDVTLTPLNTDYLNKMQEGNIADRVFILEKKASRYNVKESPFFNPLGLSEIYFSQKRGKILATYNSNGKIVSTSERYKDLILPMPVRNAVFKGYPGWTIYGNTYLVSYWQNKGTKKAYKIKIRKDGLKKNLKFDVDGNRI